MWVAGAMVASAAIGAYGSNRAAGKQADAMSAGSGANYWQQKKAAKALQQGYNQANELYSPYQEMGEELMPYVQGLATGGAQEQTYVDQLGQLQPIRTEGQYLDQLQGLSPEINIDLENSPIYQAQKTEMLRNLGNQYSARGLSGSSASEDAMIRNMAPLIQEEYGRQVGDYNREYNALNNLYGNTADFNQRGFSNEATKLGNLYNMQADVGARQFDKAYNVLGLGYGATGAMAGNAMNYGANKANMELGIGQSQMQQGNALAQMQADKTSQMSALPMQALGSYMNYQAYQPSGGGMGLDSWNQPSYGGSQWGGNYGGISDFGAAYGGM